MLAIKFLTVTLVFVAGLSLDLRPRQHATQVWGLTELTLEQEPLQCERYMCKPQNLTMNQDSCIHYQNDTYYLQSCAGRNDTKTFCSTDLDDDGNDNVCQTPPAEPTAVMWPGELCSSDTSCVSGNCSPQTHLCVGAGNGGDCSQNGDCNPGLFCTGGSCRPQQLKGMSCSSEFDCQNSLGCNKTSMFIGTCIPYFSVPVGGYVTDCMSDATSYLCLTGTCQQVTYRGVGVCVKSIKSLAQQPQACLQNSDCLGSSGSADFESVCKCGVNPTGTSYCFPFIGDPVGKGSLFYWMQLTTSNATQQCNTMRRFNYNCIMSLPVTYAKQAIVANMLYLYYPELQGNDACIKSIYNSYYWGASTAVWTASTVAALLVALY